MRGHFAGELAKTPSSGSDYNKINHNEPEVQKVLLLPIVNVPKGGWNEVCVDNGRKPMCTRHACLICCERRFACFEIITRYGSNPSSHSMCVHTENIC